MKGKILIIEDETKLSEVMSIYLQKEGYEVFYAKDGEEGELLIEKDNFDLIILDIMMPKKDGWSLLRKIKSRYKNTVVILTTARGEEEDRIFGFELGADDYMVKPLSLRELVLRVNLRIKSRSSFTSSLKDSYSNVLTLDNLFIYENSHTVTENGNNISLTPKEFELMLFFVKNPNIVFNRNQLLDKVWGYDFLGDTRTVDTHIKNLREKINVFNKNLKTIWRVGYKLES
ncbi:response regulator transcription factor [Clostridium sp. MSJ-4]|uniref:Response regulator transcription factor n=1 Tax=Clostridium simiarum TaxID=2841506 RepID=A0ABS6F0T0_9CLOT|nr:response regulator transcription factor [Clostridium simiarum]MBU5592000.1 response regulator transcription factor [Clostridium simiarum]